jgi:hypothetical protein
VRFSLDMGVDKGMRSSARLQPSAKVTVKPIDSHQEEARFSKASSWAKKDLDSLNVRFQQSPKIDLNDIVGKVQPWSEGVQEGRSRFVHSNTLPDLDRRVSQLNSVDTSSSGALEMELNRIKEQPTYFFFDQLQLVMSSTEGKNATKLVGRPPTTPTDRGFPAIDPSKTDETIESRSSEGKPEEPVEQLASRFISLVLGAMDIEFRTLKWSEGRHTTRIRQTYPFHPLITSMCPC